MATVDYDINVYRRRYFANHPEKRMQYRINEACALLIREYGLDGAKVLLDAKCGNVSPDKLKRGDD